jgi:hypothetical protein
VKIPCGNRIFQNINKIFFVSFTKNSLNFFGENFNISEDHIISVKVVSVSVFFRLHLAKLPLVEVADYGYHVKILTLICPGSNQVAKNIKGFFKKNSYLVYSQIWLKFFADDCQLRCITSFEKKTLAQCRTAINKPGTTDYHEGSPHDPSATHE